jgi:hypothetical protein
MRRCPRFEDGPSARTLVILAATYAGAAGLHGVLAVRFCARWQAVVALVLLLAAIGFLALAARLAARRSRPPRSTSPRQVVSEPAVPVPRREQPLPAQRGGDHPLHDRG